MKNTIALPICLILALSASGIGAQAPQELRQESQPEEIIVPEGTVVPIILTAYLNTRSTQIGDTVYADTVYPVWVQQRLVIPKGSNIRGTVTNVVQPGKIKGRGSIAVRFDDILLPNGVRRDFVATFKGIHSEGEEKIDRKAETVSSGAGTTSGDVGTVIGTTSSGAIIGSIVGSGTGAALGGGIGAAGGIATVLMTRDRHLVLNPGTQFDLELKRPLKFAFNELEFTPGQLSNAERESRPKPAATRGNSSNQRGSRIGGIWPFPGIRVPLR